MKAICFDIPLFMHSADLYGGLPWNGHLFPQRSQFDRLSQHQHCELQEDIRVSSLPSVTLESDSVPRTWCQKGVGWGQTGERNSEEAAAGRCIVLASELQ